MKKDYRWGLFVGQVKLVEYTNDEYEKALEDLNTAYQETGVRHQLRLI